MAIDREKVLLAAQGYIQKKRYDRAVAEYQKIIQQDPDDARTLLKIGDLQSKMEAHADAIATRIVSEGSIRLDPPGIELTAAELVPTRST